MAIEEAQALLARVRAQTDSILVGVSGGKDSLTTIDLVSRAGFARVEGVYWYLLPDLAYEESRVRFAERRYKVKIHRVPSPQLLRALKDGVYCPAYLELDHMHTFAQKDIERTMERRTGIGWFAYGMRRSDSIQRQIFLTKVEGFDTKSHRVYPIWTWTDKEVMAYLRRQRVPIPQTFGKRSSGAGLNPEGILFLYENRREDYERLRAVFPHIQAFIHRHLGGEGPIRAKERAQAERKRARAAERSARVEAPEVHDPSHPPPSDPVRAV